jgi:predicted nuclease of predicted toxin-antitoxin system
VKFIVDAQLPVKLAGALTAAGHDAIHTLTLPDKNRSSDSYITRLADLEGRIVISKDGDFVTSHILHGAPLRLLQVSTGNMPNSILLPLVLGNLDRIAVSFASFRHVELTASTLIAHA